MEKWLNKWQAEYRHDPYQPIRLVERRSDRSGLRVGHLTAQEGRDLRDQLAEVLEAVENWPDGDRKDT